MPASISGTVFQALSQLYKYQKKGHTAWSIREQIHEQTGVRLPEESVLGSLKQLEQKGVVRSSVERADSPTPYRVWEPVSKGKRGHYKIDKHFVALRTKRDRRKELEQLRDYGYYTYYVPSVVPIQRIVPKKVWNQWRLDSILEGLRKGAEIPPIMVAKKGSRFEILDGIHRYNASKIMGFTHIPVIYSVRKH